MNSSAHTQPTQNQTPQIFYNVKKKITIYDFKSGNNNRYENKTSQKARKMKKLNSVNLVSNNEMSFNNQRNKSALINNLNLRNSQGNQYETQNINNSKNNPKNNNFIKTVKQQQKYSQKYISQNSQKHIKDKIKHKYINQYNDEIKQDKYYDKQSSSIHINVQSDSNSTMKNQQKINKSKSLTQHQAIFQHSNNKKQINNDGLIDRDNSNPVLINTISDKLNNLGKTSKHSLIVSRQQKLKQKQHYRYKRLHFSSHKNKQQTSKLSLGSMHGINNTNNNTNNSNVNISTSIYDLKRKTERDMIFSKMKNPSLLIFYNKVHQLQMQYLNYAMNDQFQKSAQIIISLLNYTVDLNLPQQFNMSLKILADYYLLTNKINQSIFYYNQTRQSSLLLYEQQNLLIQSLIGLSKCLSKYNLQFESIIILKKALQYSWYYDKKQLQLILYDQIGQKYYHLGDLDKAKKYHYRFINSIYEPSTSAHKSLSKQRIKKLQQINIQIKYNELSILFLVHLKIPIRSCKQIPSILKQNNNMNNIITGRKHTTIHQNVSFLDAGKYNNQQKSNLYLNAQNMGNTSQNNSQQEDSNQMIKTKNKIQHTRVSRSNLNFSIRDQFNINKKYFTHFQDIQSWIKNIMKNWFFVQEMDQPLLSNQDWTAPLKLKKFAYIDFKLNQHLKKFNSSSNVNNNLMQTKKSVYKDQSVQYKLSLDQKIQRKIQQVQIDPQWYEKMIQQIVRDHKNKLLNVRDGIRMRGYNKQIKPSIQSLKQVYNKFFQKKNKPMQKTAINNSFIM